MSPAAWVILPSKKVFAYRIQEKSIDTDILKKNS